MHLINLTIDDKNLETILTILNNLQDDLISKIEVNSTASSVERTQYQPQTNKIILEKDSATHDTSGKYASASAYKQKLKRSKEN